MPPRPPQKVTVADLDDADRDLIARARAAMAHVEPTRFNLAAGAAALLAAHVLAKAWRARRAGPAVEDKVELDIDSAFGTPTRASAPTSRRTNAAAGRKSAGSRAGDEDGVREASRLRRRESDDASADGAQQPRWFRACSQTRVLFQAEPIRRRRGRAGAAALAKTAVIKATRRLKRSGELRVDVLEVTFTHAFDARFANDDDTTAGSVPETFAFRVAVDAGANASIRGSTTARAYDNKRRRDVVTFNKRLAFSAGVERRTRRQENRGAPVRWRWTDDREDRVDSARRAQSGARDQVLPLARPRGRRRRERASRRRVGLRRRGAGRREGKRSRLGGGAAPRRGEGVKDVTDDD